MCIKAKGYSYNYISSSTLLDYQVINSSRMKQVAAVILCFAAVQLVACQRAINKEYCQITKIMLPI